MLAEIALVFGDLPTAAEYLEAAIDATEESGSAGPLATAASRLGQILCRLGRVDEAAELVEMALGLTEPGDVSVQVNWRQAQALVHSARGEHAAAERLAREAISWAGRGDSPLFAGDARHVLGEVLDAAGSRNEALAAWQEALGFYDRKEVIPLVRSVRERLEALQPT